ncbi:MAG: DUF58 domain-containing protein [Acidimicrobiales bacterium]
MFTRNGISVAGLCAVLFLFGWLLGYSPLIVIAGALLAALLTAVALVAQKPTMEIGRRVVPNRVIAGQDAVAVLTIRNAGRRVLRDGVALERFGDGIIPVNIPELPPGDSVEMIEVLPTEHRGVYQVGPLVINRSDPLGLVRKGEWKASSETLWVHPLLHDVAPFPSGMARDLDGASSGEAPEGGVAFQNLREYVVGDDRRLIHWRSSARTGKLMVRHNVDTHQPRSLILLDTRPDVYAGDGFEDAIRAAASLAISSLRGRFPFRVRTTCGRSFDQGIGYTKLLDEFAALQPQAEGSLHQLAQIAAREPGSFSVAIITGPGSTDEVVHLGRLSSQFDAVTLCRLGVQLAGDGVALPGAIVLNAHTSSDFARFWNRKVRR